MKVIFSKQAQKEYDAWEKSNPKVNEKIVELIVDISKNGCLIGIGKPEQLKHYKKTRLDFLGTLANLIDSFMHLQMIII